ncbi:PKD domain-containing protein, partial [Aeromicrobium duanguangcaii]
MRVPLSRVVAAVAVLSLSFAVLPAFLAPAQAADDRDQAPMLRERAGKPVVTADPLGTVQVNGSSSMVWAQAMIGNTVYAGGKFSHVHPAGTAENTNLTERGNLVAFDIRTGVMTSWNPSVNGVVKAVAASPDGARVYVGGTFTVANGSDRFNFAAFDAQTGDLIPGFTAAVGGAYVNAIVATNEAVYVGGLFSAGNGVSRRNLAAFSPSGSLLGWAPTTDLQVDAMALDPTGQLIIGGRFANVNTTAQRGLAALDLQTGAKLPFAVADVVKNGLATGSNAGNAGIWGLSADENGVYGTGWVSANTATGNLEGTFAAEAGSGAVRWIADCHGDHYAIHSDGDSVYTTSHEHSCDSIGGIRNGPSNGDHTRHASAYTTEAVGKVIRPETVSDIYLDWSGKPAPAEYDWFPEWLVGKASGSGQAGWSIVGNEDFIAVGGEFTGVNNRANHGLVRFAKAPAGGSQTRPLLSGSSWTPTVKSVRRGANIVTIPTNNDRDNSSLTYEFRRVGQSRPFATVKQKAIFWSPSVVSATDPEATPGQSVSYQVRTIDSDGNVADSAQASVTTRSSPTLEGYAAATADTRPLVYYRMGTGTSLTDVMGTVNGSGGSMSNVAGALAGDGDNGTRFTGTSLSRASSSSTIPVPNELSYEMWFRTNATNGGVLASLGNSASGSSSTYDRSLYMSNNGRLNFASYFGVWRTTSTEESFNDNEWHHVAVTQSLDGTRIYVDGRTVASDQNNRYGRRAFNARVRLGGDNTSGFPNRPSNQWFTGSIDEFALYPYALTPAQVTDHRDRGVGATPPVAAFASSVDGAQVAFDASGSTASGNRTITGYAWDFGDGTTGTGATPSHTYDEAGTYAVTLTVTDSGNSTSQVTQNVNVHRAPVADFTATATGLEVGFDPSPTTTSSGATIVGHAWDFGDGATSTQATPVHEYDEDGTYEVTLRVTDSLGAVSAPVKHDVTVKGSATFAADAFGRSVGTGWGAADVGGAWSGTAGFSVSDGVGKVSVPATVTRSTLLPVGVGDAASTFSVAVDKPVAGGVAQFNYWVHRNSTGEYRVKLRYLADGTVTVWLTKNIGTTETLLADGGTLAGFTQAAGAELKVRVETVTSGGSTTLRTKVWPAGAAEPTAWRASTNDATAALQAPGQVGYSFYANGAVSNGPLTWAVDNLAVRGEKPVHEAPVANFTHESTGLTLAVDPSVNTSQGATVASYAWNFGDGSTSTERTPTHRYDEPGTYQVRLVVTDSEGAQSEPVTKSVTVAHANPTAAFDVTAAEMNVAADATASSATDDATLTYSWDWGDGSAPSTGVTANHTYEAASTYTVTLTVNDSLGGTATATRQVLVKPTSLKATDAFGRSVGTGWGAADVGGAWSGTAGFSVSDGVGKVSVPATVTRSTLLPVGVGDAASTFSVAVDKPVAGGVAQFNYWVHRNSTGEYRVKLRYLADGTVTVWLTKNIGTTETLLADGGTLAGFTQAAGAELKVRVETVTSGGSTTLRTKVWPAGAAEPTAWRASTNDATAALQAPGQVGYSFYANGAVSNGPLTWAVDNLAV